MTALALVMTTALWTAPLPEADILGQADARIEKHRKGEVVLRITANEPLPPGAVVHIEQTRHAFLFGCNIFKLDTCGSPEANEAYEKRFAELLNYATLPFYWWGYEKQRGKPDYDKTDKMIAWCKAHGVTTKGHPLAWNYRDVEWLPTDPAEVFKLQMARIETCCRHFAGGINIWDVVNEATHYDREECKKNAPRLTSAIDHAGVGPYLRAAFEAARKGNPKATLIINDYRTDEAYATKVLDELKDKDGKPLFDVLGIQSHQHGGAWPVTKIWETCERYAKYGKPLHFTETTFLSGERGWNVAEQKRKSDPNFKWSSTPEGEKRQAEEVARFYTILFSHPAVEAITWWDFTDYHAWQGAPAGLVRADMTPKPAYEELMKRVKGTWWTKLDARTDDANQVRFRGVFGDYKVTVKAGDQELTGSFSLTRESKGPIEVRLR